MSGDGLCLHFNLFYSKQELVFTYRINVVSLVGGLQTTFCRVLGLNYVWTVDFINFNQANISDNFLRHPGNLNRLSKVDYLYDYISPWKTVFLILVLPVRLLMLSFHFIFINIKCNEIEVCIAI